MNKEQIDFVKDLSLTSVASSLGFTIVKKGSHYSLKEMDSLMIYDDKTWYRWSGKGNRKGGSTIDFVIEFGNVRSGEYETVDAVNYLLEFSGCKNLSSDEIKKMSASKPLPQEKKDEEKIMIMPKKNSEGYKRAYAYLTLFGKKSPSS